MIRPYKTSDKTELIEVFNLNVPKYFDPKEQKDLIEYLEQKPETYLIIEYEKRIIGGVGYEIRESDRS